jgi:hypothetical protein
MKKALFTLFILLFVFNLASISQDILYKTDGTKEQVKITMVSDKEVQYKKFNNPDGPVYTIQKKDLIMITYENGDFETIKSANHDKQAAKAELAENFAKNLLTYHLFDVVYGDFTFSYERILASGTVGIKIPFGFGYAYDIGNFNSNTNWVKNLFYSGIGVNFYPTGQGRWRYFVGPNIRVGYGKMDETAGYYDQYGNWINPVSHEGIYTKFFMDNGVIYTPVRNFSVASIVGFGVRFFPEAGNNQSSVRPSGYFSINMSYRF